MSEKTVGLFGRLRRSKRISHSKFGTGIVMEVVQSPSFDVVTVKFNQGKPKQIFIEPGSSYLVREQVES